MADGAHDVERIAEESFIYLYPLVLMDITRKQLTSGVQPAFYAPMNAFNHMLEYPPLDFKAVVRPNFDTLYSSAWLDLTGGPVVVSVPDSGGRYYLLPTLDMWTDVVASPGWRTTGTGPGDFVYLPPGWAGEIPEDLEPIQCTTMYMWIIGRTQTNGPDDYAAVNEFQRDMRVIPLDEWGTEVPPAVAVPDTSVDQTAPLEQIEAMSTGDFFEYAAELMKLNPPNSTDYSHVWRMRNIGMTVGESFDFETLDGDTQAMFDRARETAYGKMMAASKHLGTPVNGWSMPLSVMGVYGNEYLHRAAVALAGLGANQLADAIYPIQIDNVGPTVDPVVLHFDADGIPPVGAFWSVTLYDDKGFAVPNAINRGSIADWMDLAYNDDGSLDLYIQPDSPGPDLAANWLPSPADRPWNLTLRLYAPLPDALDGTWTPPTVHV